MRLIIAGGREFTDYALLERTLNSLPYKISTIICGEARGADLLGRRYAEENNIDIESFPADWDKHGKSAGYIRNKEMCDEATALIAFWDSKSLGTKNMIRISIMSQLLVKVILYNKHKMKK